MNKPIVILGGPNTGTSSLVGMLNAHPQSLMLYETDLNALLPTKYAKRLLTAAPELRSVVRAHAVAESAYDELLAHARTAGFDFRVAGDKLPYFDKASFGRFRNFKIIYSHRNPAEWIAKVAYDYAAEHDVRPLLIDYLGGLLNAKAAVECLIVQFDDFLADNRKVMLNILEFVGLAPMPETVTWWKTVGKYADPYRSSQKWWKAHGSSMVEPRRNDTQIHRKDNNAWHVIDVAFAQANSLPQGRTDAPAIKAMQAAFVAALGSAPIPIASLMEYETRRVALKKRTLRGVLNNLLPRKQFVA